MLNLKPTYFVNGTVDQLDLKKLKADGIKGLILDLDNTIMRPRKGIFCEIVAPWLQEAKVQGLKLIIVTNNTNEKYLSSLEELLGQLELPMIIKAGKPKPHKLEEALAKLNLPASQVCIVGDRVLTDVLGGERVSIKTALVEPLLGKEENPLFRLLRRIEKICLHPSYW
jgi:HAD superfamily phosphatase (TIGR01668 family)